MQLRYYHVIFELQGKNCPPEFWESIVTELKMILAIYGHSLADKNDPHQLHCIFEDDTVTSSYARLPQEYKDRVQFLKPVKHVVPYAANLKMELLDKPNLPLNDDT